MCTTFDRPQLSASEGCCVFIGHEYTILDRSGTSDRSTCEYRLTFFSRNNSTHFCFLVDIKHKEWTSFYHLDKAQCNVDPLALEARFNRLKLGLTGVYIILVCFAQNINSMYSLEPP